MKSTALTIIKLFLLGLIIVLLMIFLSPVTIKLKDIKPAVKPGTTQVQNEENKESRMPMETEDMVALLFGWSRPRVTARPVPRITPQPVPNAVEEFGIVAVRNAKIVSVDGITRYYCKKLNVKSGFWISTQETNAEGWRLLDIIPDTGYLVLHNNQRKILRFEK